MAEKHFYDNLHKYDKPIKLIKDLIEYNEYLFSIYDNEYIYTFDTKQSKGYETTNYYITTNYRVVVDQRYKFYIQFFFKRKEPVRNKCIMKFLSFIIVKVFNHWVEFTKKRKRQRIFLKLLKPVSLHLGNPRFVNFNV